ncbi:hypothetical protein fugu_007743 [Takifugu bimaculatus]|uniref:adenylate cyclase n=1 Tax=Takifugu bimaculatus TaxID=433685 RepID=A0A4Z2AZ93_9TELE|nr:hypothetical protein fugu_007743 [Takifugu bimaculatus]
MISSDVLTGCASLLVARRSAPWETAIIVWPGCPEPSPDHAYCCVEMGLGMIQAIEQFCQETRETVSMRVGVHTGTVLCGILGMKRFKFDVWSNDVNLANLMEQLGVAGKIHLSEATAQFLGDHYQREDGRVLERAGQSSGGETQGDEDLPDLRKEAGARRPVWLF